MVKRLLFGLLVLSVRWVAAETLFANYFDIQTGSGSGTEVTGKIHLRSNKDAHTTPIPVYYTFLIISDPSGIFEIEDQRDSESRLFGALKVAAGQSVSASPTSYPLTVELSDGTSTLATANISISAVASPLLDELTVFSQNLALSEGLLYGRTSFSDSQVASYITELEASGGALSGFAFYTQPLTSFANTQPALENDLEAAANIIGGLGKAYVSSSIYGPGGNASERARLKAVLYDALETFADRLPMDPAEVVYLGQPIGDDYGDGFFGLNNDGFKATSFSFLSHPWRIPDPLVGPCVWLMPEILSELKGGDPQAIRLQEKLVELYQISFGLVPNYHRIDEPTARWGQLTDTNHTEGALSDANLGHNYRAWVNLPTIWSDYNRPVTYTPYWYDEYYDAQGYPDAVLIPGWEPNGVLDDLHFWFTHWHRPAHLWGQSGFHPDGTVTHHLSADSSDVAMNAYGYTWLTEVIDGYEMFRDTSFDMGSAGFQFIADRYLYSYDKFIYKGDFDFTVSGRSYFSDMSGNSKFVDDMVGDINDLLAAKQPGTVISNETELVAWRDSIANDTHEQSGSYPFWVGQSLVHRRGGQGGEDPYYFSVKMKNDRTTGAEDFESPKKSWHSGSGILQARVRGDEYDKTRFNWDWHALPGLTAEWRTDSIVYDKDFLPGGSAYAGMASDGRYGFAAMEHRSPSGSYSVADADKGFFFTEKEAVALGASVHRSNGGQNREIITTVDQTLWVGTVTYSMDGAAPSTISQGANTDITLNPANSSWIHQGSVGYVIFPAAGQPLYIRGGSSVNMTDPGNSTGNDVIHFALGHGTNPTAGNRDSYHYVMVPNITAAEMPAYVTDLTSRVEIVANGGGVQGIYESSLELLQLAFYSAGTAQTTNGLEVSSDRAALVQLRKVAGDWSLCVTDPKHEYAATEINLQISESLEPGSYNYSLPGIYPMAGESMEVSAAASSVSVKVLLPDADNDAAYNYQGVLYAGAPVHKTIPAGGPLPGPLAFTTVVFEDDFDSYASDAAVPTGGKWTSINYNEASNVYVHVRTDTNNLFGAGTTNRYLGYRDAGSKGSSLVAQDKLNARAARLSFDFIEPDNGLTGSLSVRMGIDDVKISEFEVVGGVRPVGGTLQPSGSYALDAKSHADIYFNEQTNSITYLDPNGAAATLASGKMDVWLNGVNTADDVVNDRNIGANSLSDIKSLRFESYSTGMNEVWFDNLEIAIATPTSPGGLYLAWAAGYNLIGDDAGMLANPDGDALDNLAEYALGGIPTNGNDAAGIFPTTGTLSASVFEYIHRRHTDAAALGLNYIVERNTNLISGTWTTNGVSISGTAPAETGFETVTNHLSTTGEPEQYMRLSIKAE